MLFLGTSILLGFQSDLDTQESCKTFTIYLVRHAEKDLKSNNGGDPPLTKCGEERAEKLSVLLGDVHLDAVYSTDYARTRNTALPTAKSKELDILEYDASNLEAFAKLLVDKKEDALVVGHSNTTAVLAGLLVGEEQAGIDLDTYNRVYQVVMHKKRGRLHLLHTAFDCNE